MPQENKKSAMKKLTRFFASTKIADENPKTSAHELKMMIEKVRCDFLKRVDDKPDDYDDVDIDRVKYNEFTVKRFITWNHHDCDKAVDQLDEAMKWRKSFGVNTKSELDAPIEFFQAGAIFHCGYDKELQPVIYFRAKTVVKNKAFDPLYHILGVGIINKIDLETNGFGFVNVLDLSGVSYKNADLELIHFVLTLLKKYFPESLKRIIVYNIPWYLKGFVPMVKMWLTASQQDLLKFCSGDDIFKYIDKEQLPVYMGGDNDTDFTFVPEGCKPAEELCEEYGFTREEFRKYMKMYKHHIEEGQLLAKGGKRRVEEIEADDMDELPEEVRKQYDENKNQMIVTEI